MIYYILVLCCILNAAMDSIDHSKRSKGVYSLWHVVKNLFVGILVITILVLDKAFNLTLVDGYYLPFDNNFYLALAGDLLWRIPVIGLGWMALWETSYRLFNKVKLHKLDDKWECKFLQRVYTFKRRDVK